MGASITFNKIFLLHSLQKEEYRLTDKLELQAFPELQRQRENFQFVSYETNSHEQMNHALDVITEEAKKSEMLPLIQFDMHGTTESFLTKDFEPILFEDIYSKLAVINKLSRFNLLLVIVSCEGASFISQMLPTRPSPCWGIIGSSKNFVNVEASNFVEMYEKVLHEERGWRVTDILNDGISKTTRFTTFAAEEIFKTIFKMYIENYAGEQKATERAASIQDSLGRGYTDLAEFSKIKENLLDLESQFDKCKRIFFMIDEIPENARRFPLIVHDIYDVPLIGGASHPPK
jgi:hypothetical protein